MELHPDLSFCRVQDQFVFLNLAQDRYFSLGQDLAHAFGALLDGMAEPQSLALLEKRGIVVTGVANPIVSCEGRSLKASMLDLAAGSTSVARVATLAVGFALMRTKLRRHGIAGPATELAAARNSAKPSHDGAELGATARAYDWLCLVRGAHNLCLPHSLALAIDLARKGYAAEVVLGVQLRPFAAHCWVECQGTLVNDRFDRVRSYTPIRRL